MGKPLIYIWISNKMTHRGVEPRSNLSGEHLWRFFFFWKFKLRTLFTFRDESSGNEICEILLMEGVETGTDRN